MGLSVPFTDYNSPGGWSKSPLIQPGQGLRNSRSRTFLPRSLLEHLEGLGIEVTKTIAIGFIWGGWVTGGTARSMSAMAENSGRMSVLVLMCVAQFTAADGAVAKFKGASSYSRDNVISEFVKTVASTNMDYSRQGVRSRRGS
jgi:hypothetical protein